ncbi:MAG: MoaD/ThiS family protein [Candidatus Hodarchaeales archaeon]|jgi:molybdopterin synthase sulfur carrier subunit
MNITVTFYGPLAQWAGKKSFCAKGNTVRDVFKDLEYQIGKSVLDHMINRDTGKIQSHFHILLNGRDIESLNGLEEEVKDGDTLVCVPPVGGG